MSLQRPEKPHGTEGAHAAMKEIEEFKRALEEEFSKRSAALRADSDRFISDQIFLARRKTETKVHAIRAGHEKRYGLLLEKEKRRALLQVREDALDRISSFLEETTARVGLRIAALRGDRKTYGGVLSRLVMEALDALEDEAVILVLPGEGELVPGDERIKAVEESGTVPSWGGCLATDARTRSVFIDNTIKTRWDLYQKDLLRLFSERYRHVLEEFERFSREFRLP